MRYSLLAIKQSGAEADVDVHVRRQVVQVQSHPTARVRPVVPVTAADRGTEQQPRHDITQTLNLLILKGLEPSPDHLTEFI